MKRTQNKTLTEDGEEKQVAEIGLYSTVQVLDYWGRWANRQYLVVDKFVGNWVVCEHWQSVNNHNEHFSQLGTPLIVKADRLRVHPEKPYRPLPWDWYKSIEDFVRFCKSRVGGIGTPVKIEVMEEQAYK